MKLHDENTFQFSKKENRDCPEKWAARVAAGSIEKSGADTVWEEGPHRSSLQQSHSQEWKAETPRLKLKVSFLYYSQNLHTRKMSQLASLYLSFFVSHSFQDTCFKIQAIAQKGNKTICKKH